MPHTATAIMGTAQMFGVPAGQAQDLFERVVAPAFQQRLQALGQVEILQQHQPRPSSLRTRRRRTGEDDHRRGSHEQPIHGGAGCRFKPWSVRVRRSDRVCARMASLAAFISGRT